MKNAADMILMLSFSAGLVFTSCTEDNAGGTYGNGDETHTIVSKQKKGQVPVR